ncbi:MAG TPA: 16S rRNA (cytosine(967)-C(5))-methyltransferase RsmB [Pyrinomonadaceae bacterium]|nr:16S rRNA (cytosine(967)-C(5))-methyltransferase RsmB [Pyrinomonadaceae bacterium]
MPTSKSSSPARSAAFGILLRVEEGAYASVLLATTDTDLSPVDRGLCYELVMGVLRHQLWLDRLVEVYAGRKIEKLDLRVRLILRLGLYQLRFLSRIPASAAVNESVKLVNVARMRSASGFVNAVLRRATREPEVDPLSTVTDPLERISIKTSHPLWLLEKWASAFGVEEAAALAQANNGAPPVSFRVIRNRASTEEVISELQKAGLGPTPSKIARNAWRCSKSAPLLLQMAAEGKIYLQDEASQLVPEVLGAKPNERVLDLCSAPGSKTTQIADEGSDRVRLVASDLHAHRLRTVSLAASVQGLTNIHCLVVDGLKTLPFAEQSFDRVLVDAPCSGTGTLRRNPEIRWRLTAADIEDLSMRQQQLLSNAAASVKTGGRLVYSTCSVEPEENESVRQRFIESNPHFESVEVNLNLPVFIKDGAARTWPHYHDTDGFFICAFERETA